MPRWRRPEVTDTTAAEVMTELAALENPKIREVNERHGDDHGVNLGKLRALATRLKTQQELARRLWDTERSCAWPGPLIRIRGSPLPVGR